MMPRTALSIKTQKPDGIFFLWLLAFICLLPWAIIQSQTSINSNTAWLTHCAKLLLDGGSMAQDCYDTNPPLSILIHTLPIFLEKLTGFHSYHWIFILGLSLALIGSLLTQYFLNKLEWANRPQTAIISISILASLALLSGLVFTDRDHLIAMMFIPFSLCQACLTQRAEINKPLQYFTLLSGSFLILLKPYYGLLPALLLIHRLYKTKSLNTLLSADLIILSTATLSYIALVYFCFNDYITQIAPDALTLYAPYGSLDLVWPKTRFILILLTCNMLLSICIAEKKTYPLLLLLNLSALNGLLSFILQLKGFTYHLLPTYAALAGLITLTILLAIRYFSSERTSKNILVNSAFILLIFALCYTAKPPNSQYPTHNDYQNNGLTQIIDKYCTDDCSYLIAYENMDIVSQIAYYHPAQYASRFPTFWFCPIIDQALNNTDSKPAPLPQVIKKFTALKQKYFTYIAQDIARFKPSVILILQGGVCGFRADEPEKNIIDAVMENYQKIETLETDRAAFYKNTSYDFPHILKWDVYLPKDSPRFKDLKDTNNPL